MAIVNIGFLQDLLQTISRRDARQRRPGQRNLPSTSQGLIEVCQKLMESDGEASSIVLAQAALDIYKQLDSEQKQAFFSALATAFSADANAITQAYEAWQGEHDEVGLSRLFSACEPRRQELLRRLNLPAGGTLELVRMREDLLNAMGADASLEAVDKDFQHLFASWFNRGFLVMRRIDWQTPAAILEQIIAYEAVHAISDWQDLRRRLDQRDRRCFAFFHPAIGDEPLIFVEVALEAQIPSSVQELIGERPASPDSAQATTAAFYSISNCQRGLRGVSFGNFLIKQVVMELSQELPQLKQFVTLSPIPGFKRWLDATRDQDSARLSPALQAALDNTAWADDEAQASALRDELLPLAAHYLAVEKKNTASPRDPVAGFHLGNGARLERLNWLGDRSPKGLKNALGMMVNYLYVPDEIESNHERFSADGTIAQSGEVKELVRRARKQLQGARSHER